MSKCSATVPDLSMVALSANACVTGSRPSPGLVLCACAPAAANNAVASHTRRARKRRESIEVTRKGGGVTWTGPRRVLLSQVCGGVASRGIGRRFRDQPVEIRGNSVCDLDRDQLGQVVGMQFQQPRSQGIEALARSLDQQEHFDILMDLALPAVRRSDAGNAIHTRR